MPKLTNKIPSYRLHRPSGQAVVTLDGRDYYLGDHGSADSQDRYKRLIAEWLAGHRQTPQQCTHGEAPTHVRWDLSINELFLAYWDFAQTYYVKNGKPSSEIEPIRQSLKPLTAMYGSTPASTFGPLGLEAVQFALQ